MEVYRYLFSSNNNAYHLEYEETAGGDPIMLFTAGRADMTFSGFGTNGLAIKHAGVPILLINDLAETPIFVDSDNRTTYSSAINSINNI